MPLTSLLPPTLASSLQSAYISRLPSTLTSHCWSYSVCIARPLSRLVTSTVSLGHTQITSKQVEGFLHQLEEGGQNGTLFLESTSSSSSCWRARRAWWRALRACRDSKRVLSSVKRVAQRQIGSQSPPPILHACSCSSHSSAPDPSLSPVLSTLPAGHSIVC